MILRELIAKFGIDFDRRGAAIAEAAVNKLKSGFTGLQAALGSIGIAMVGRFVRQQISAADSLNDVAVRLGMTTDELQRYRFAGERAGMEQETMDAALGRLSRGLAEARAGAGAGADAFRQYGISLRNADGTARSTQDVFLGLADTMQGISDPQERMRLAFQVFGRQGAGLINVLQDGSAGVQELFNRFEELGGGMSQEFIRKAGEADDALVDLNVGVDSLKADLILGLAPSILAGIKRFTGFVQAMREVEERTGAVSAALRALGVLAAIVATIFLVKWVIATWPILLIAGGILLLILLVQDFITFLQGGDSVIGDFLAGLFGMKDGQAVLEVLKTAWNDMMATIDEVINTVELWKNRFMEAMWFVARVAQEAWSLIREPAEHFFNVVLHHGIGAFELFKTVVTGVLTVVTQQFQTMFNVVSGIIERVTGLITNSPIGGMLGSALASVGGRFSRADAASAHAAATRAATGGTVAASARWAPAADPDAVSGKFGVQNNVSVNVQGGDNPRETGTAAQRGVEEALRRANRDAERKLTRVAR